jgi:hypothetical protein
MAHKPGHSGFSYWNGEEDKKPKKKRKRRRQVDVAKAVVKSDKESKEQKSLYERWRPVSLMLRRGRFLLRRKGLQNRENGWGTRKKDRVAKPCHPRVGGFVSPEPEAGRRQDCRKGSRRGEDRRNHHEGCGEKLLAEDTMAGDYRQKQARMK